MPEFNVRSDSVNVEQIMEQIRARIREKRGVDYTEQQIRELAAVKLEKFLDPRGVRSDLLNEFRRGEADSNYRFEDDTLYHSTRAPFLRTIRKLLNPILKLFFNPNPLIYALHMQSQINDRATVRHHLYYELIHNLVVEITRLGIEVKNLKMRVESLDARVDFTERRARALEGAVVYRPQADETVDRGRIAQGERGPARQPGPTPLPSVVPGATAAPASNAGAGSSAESAGQRSRRRRRRRGRRGGAPAAVVMGAPGTAAGEAAHDGEDADVEQAPDAGQSDQAQDSSAASDAAPHTPDDEQ